LCASTGLSIAVLRVGRCDAYRSGLSANE